jgi:hypothetical protein
MLWSVERPFAGAFAVLIPGATLRHCTGLVHAVLPASTEQGKRTLGVPQELGTPARLRLDNDRFWGWPDPNTPGPKPASGLCGATNTGARGGNRLAKATKWDGKDGRESERSIVPVKPGNSCRENPGEGRGRLVAGPWPGNSAGALNLDPLSTKRPRVAQRM